jgi:phosphatidylserine synthase
MSDPNSTSTGNSGPTYIPPPQGDWRAQRRADRDARRAAWRHGGRPGWMGVPIGGVIVLALGLVFLADNFGYHLPHNWWAVLILIPAVALLVTAIRLYRADASLSGRAVGPAVGGIVLLLIALAIFFGINWGLFWPLLLVAVGVGIIARTYWR